jgi:hypothetical protein
VYWWCPECADEYWRNFSASYYHSALFDHATGVANPAQQAWRERGVFIVDAVHLD